MLLDHIAPLLAELSRRHLAAPEAYPEQSVAALIEAGGLGAAFPAALGGCDASLVEMVDAMTAISAACPSTALLSAMPMGLAAALVAGTACAPDAHRAAAMAQLERVAAEFRRGVIYAACNSEKGAGGSLAATKTAATRTDGGFALRGEKILASFGARADVFFSTAKIATEDLPGAGIVEFFFVDAKAQGVHVASDWNGFGMRGTESHSVRYDGALAREVAGYPGFLDRTKPLQIWFCLFAAIPLGCAAASLRALGVPSSFAVRARIADAQMRYESIRAYLRETARAYRPAADDAYAQRVLRTKTWVSQEATRLCADLFALSGGRHYVRGGAMSGALADAFAGTALRPPLPLALDALAEGLTLEEV